MKYKILLRSQALFVLNFCIKASFHYEDQYIDFETRKFVNLFVKVSRVCDGPKELCILHTYNSSHKYSSSPLDEMIPSCE